MKRHGWVAALLSLPNLGLGYLYCGYPIKAATFFIIPVILYALVNPLEFYFNVPSYTLFIYLNLFLLLLLIGVIIHVIILAKRKREYTPRFYNKWYIYLSFFILSVIVSELTYPKDKFDLLFTQSSFSIPSASMHPTLKIGDRLIANTAYYKKNKPQIGDIVIYRNPKDNNKFWVKRILGLAGDTIQVLEHQVWRNGKPLKEPYVFLERDKSLGGLANTQQITVPEGHIYVLGDNRQNSLDSRAVSIHGYVSETNIHARAAEIFFSHELSRIGTKLYRVNKHQ